MNMSTPEQIAKLPKWAREHIEDLTRDLASANDLQKRMVDDQTPSPFYVDDWYAKPTVKRFINSPTNRVGVDHAGVHLDIFLAPPDDGQRLHGIELSFGPRARSVGGIAVIPRGWGIVQLVSKENIR